MNETEHLLTCLMEEAAEVQKACAKALRFGLDDTYRADNEMNLPKWDMTPREEIVYELSDMSGVTILLMEKGVLPQFMPSDIERAQAKKAKIIKMMEYARKEGTLT